MEGKEEDRQAGRKEGEWQTENDGFQKAQS